MIGKKGIKNEDQADKFLQETLGIGATAFSPTIIKTNNSDIYVCIAAGKVRPKKDIQGFGFWNGGYKIGKKYFKEGAVFDNLRAHTSRRPMFYKDNDGIDHLTFPQAYLTGTQDHPKSWLKQVKSWR